MGNNVLLNINSGVQFFCCFFFQQDLDDIEDLPSAKLSKISQEKDARLDVEIENDKTDDDSAEKIEIPGERVTTDTAERGLESSVHTALENLHLDSKVIV